MIFRRLFDPKLAQASYLIGCPSSREAIVVDPNRAINQYLDAAREEDLRILHVTETHIHADFVSGARELAHRTGARLYLSQEGGSDWGYRYGSTSGATLLKNDSSIQVGRIRLQVLHVPGHTPEHLAFLVADTAKALEPMGALTGDFVFVGDVGRPDLLERAAQASGTMESAARQLFGSLQEFRRNPDYLQIWPGHGAGSACGKSLSAVPQSTLGYEKRFNWAFGITDETEFVRAVLAGQPEPPRYFARMKRINQAGPPLLETRLPTKLSNAVLQSVLGSGAIVLDTREASHYANGAVPGTINIPAGRTFTTYAGSLLPYDRDLYLIGDHEEIISGLVQDLAGIGLERVQGYFGTEVYGAWRQAHGQLQQIPSITLTEFIGRQSGNGQLVLDVRSEGEWNAGHVPGSLNIPVARLAEQVEQIPSGYGVLIHCQTGARAAIGASLLRAHGITDVSVFSGGFAEWRAAGLPVDSQTPGR